MAYYNNYYYTYAYYYYTYSVVKKYRVINRYYTKTWLGRKQTDLSYFCRSLSGEISRKLTGRKRTETFTVGGMDQLDGELKRKYLFVYEVDSCYIIDFEIFYLI